MCGVSTGEVENAALTASVRVWNRMTDGHCESLAERIGSSKTESCSGFGILWSIEKRYPFAGKFARRSHCLEVDLCGTRYQTAENYQTNL